MLLSDTHPRDDSLRGPMRILLTAEQSVGQLNTKEYIEDAGVPQHVIVLLPY